MDFGSQLSRIINTGRSRSVILYGNVHDLYQGKEKWLPLVDYLSERYAISSTDEKRGIVVVKYELNKDIEIIGPESKHKDSPERSNVFKNWSKIIHGSENGLISSLNNTHKNGLYAFELMRTLSDVSRKCTDRNYDLCFVVEGADLLIPEDQINRMNLYDRKRLSIVQDWFSDPEFVNGYDTAILLSEARSLIHNRISRLPQVTSVEVPSPDLNTRKAYISDNHDTLPFSIDEMGQKTAGLSLYAIRQILRSKNISNDVIVSKVEDYISSQLGDGVVEFKKPSHTLDDVVGFSNLKKFAREELIPRFQADGDDALPGCAVSGPIGGGKTFFFEAISAELGMPVLVMKSIRSQWFGQTDVIFENFQRAIKALDKVVIFVDEADTVFGKIQGGHETERRLTGKIQAMMSDTRLRGRVLWMLMTARIHLLSPDILRPERMGNLIIPVLDPIGEDLSEFINWSFGHLEGYNEVSHGTLKEYTIGYSAAAFSSVRSQIKASNCKSVNDAIDVVRDMIPPNIEDTRRYQELQALLNCTRVSLISDRIKGVDIRSNRNSWREEIKELEKKEYND